MPRRLKLADMPEGWVKDESPVKYVGHALLAGGKIVTVVHYVSEHYVETVRGAVYAQDWEDYGIIPIKKLSKPEPREWESRVSALESKHHWGSSSQKIAGLPPDWPVGTKVKVIEVIE